MVLLALMALKKGFPELINKANRSLAKQINSKANLGENDIGYIDPNSENLNSILVEKLGSVTTNAYQHAYTSASYTEEYGALTTRSLGYLKETATFYELLFPSNLKSGTSWKDKQSDLRNNELGIARMKQALAKGQSLDDVASQLTDNLINFFPNNPYLPYYPKPTPNISTNKATTSVSGKIIKGGAAQVDPNAPTPSLAEDSANLRLQRERLNDPNDNANLRLQREELNDPDDNANLRLQREQYLEMLGKLLSSREGVNSYIRSKQEVTGEIIIPKGQAGKSLYDPTIQNFMDNWPNVKGLIASYEQAIWGKKDDELMPVHPGITSIASQPFGRTKPFQTPNAKTMQRVLYSGVEYGKEYAKGYLYDRGLELAFGKKAAGKIKKAEAYSNTVRTYAPNAWQAASTVLSRTLNSAGYTIGSIAGWVAQGVDLGIKAIGLIPFIGPGLAAAASAVAYAAGYAIGATLGAVSWALTALAAFAW
jgi:hypothetical protein